MGMSARSGYIMRESKRATAFMITLGFNVNDGHFSCCLGLVEYSLSVDE